MRLEQEWHRVHGPQTSPTLVVSQNIHIIQQCSNANYGYVHMYFIFKRKKTTVGSHTNIYLNYYVTDDACICETYIYMYLKLLNYIYYVKRTLKRNM